MDQDKRPFIPASGRVALADYGADLSGNRYAYYVMLTECAPGVWRILRLPGGDMHDHIDVGGMSTISAFDHLTAVDYPACLPPDPAIATLIKQRADARAEATELQRKLWSAEADRDSLQRRLDGLQPTAIAQPACAPDDEQHPAYRAVIQCGLSEGSATTGAQDHNIALMILAALRAAGVLR